jgi:hypothetical protein
MTFLTKKYFWDITLEAISKFHHIANGVQSNLLLDYVGKGPKC